MEKLRIALAGNPNCGKTTMFNALTGSNQYVGNWPGVTVEKKEGQLKSKYGTSATIVDLPGVYSLSPYTLEEVVTRNYLANERPDVIIDLVDATNLERNLYLTTQLKEMGIPMVIALNMSDLLGSGGISIDTHQLSKQLGCPVVCTSALKGTGLQELLVQARTHSQVQPTPLSLTQELEGHIVTIEQSLKGFQEARYLAVKLLENDTKATQDMAIPHSAISRAESARTELEAKHDDDIESIITDARYTIIQEVTAASVKKPKAQMTVSDKIDKIVTNRYLGIPIFMAVMFLVYYVSVTSIGTIVTDWTNDTFVGTLQSWALMGLEAVGAAPVLISLIVDGIIGGVGAVIGFVPQMAILFLFLSILEDCGYMARIAFVMDRLFRHFGLSGKSFIPLLISSGCGIPGIMASRTIEQDNDRRLTIMTATFIPCGAKLPVIALMGGVMAGYASGNYEAAAFLAPAMYFIGIAAVLISAVILKKTKPFAGKPAPFVMELPQYHIPSVRTVALHVWERLKGFIVKAGTILFLACIVMWLLSSFGFENGSFGLVEDSSLSILAYIGGFLAPVFAPLGFGTWQPVAASLSGFTAKEAIVSTMGVLANVAGDTEDVLSVATSIVTWFPTALAAFTFLIFNLLDSPCLAAIATMAQQLQSRKWFWFAVIFQNLFAWFTCLAIFQIGSLVMGGAFGFWSAVAIAYVVAMLYMLLRKDPYRNNDTVALRSVQGATV